MNVAQRGAYRRRVEESRDAVYSAILRGRETQKAIVEESGLSDNTVRRRLKDLEAEYLVRRTSGGLHIPLVREFIGDLFRIGRFLVKTDKATETKEALEKVLTESEAPQDVRAKVLARLAEVLPEELGDPGLGYVQDLRRAELLLKPPHRERVLSLLGTFYHGRVAFDLDPWEEIAGLDSLPRPSS